MNPEPVRGRGWLQRRVRGVGVRLGLQQVPATDRRRMYVATSRIAERTVLRSLAVERGAINAAVDAISPMIFALLLLYPLCPSRCPLSLSLACLDLPFSKKMYGQCCDSTSAALTTRINTGDDPVPSVTVQKDGSRKAP